MTRARWVVLLLVVAALYFAVQGGEYSTLQWLDLRRREQSEQALVRTLAREVDSLARVKKRIETDPAMQERLARELYGMLRPGEIEYTLLRDEK
ncbi:MAG TPA: septum formation initiator family protein [Gemmatimonadales bacterium]|nr:septum formation initiator family protein [Gemmatimonadales bacterium]